MKKWIKAACLALSLVLGITALGGCTSQTDSKETVTLKVCEVTHSIFYAPQYAAIELGYFEEEGIVIDLSVGEGADSVMSAVLSGDIDIGFAGPEASVYVYNEGKEDYTQVFAQLTQRDGSFLMAREPDDNFTWDKLKGKVILPGRKGGVPYMTLEYVIKKNGLDPATDLTMDNSVQYALMGPAFSAGTGDYVTMFEPSASAMEKEGKGYIVASIGADSGEIPYTAYFAKKSYLEKNSDIIDRFTRAIYKAQQWVASHTAAEIAQVIAPSFADTDLEMLTSGLQSYKDIDAWNTTPVMTQDSFDRLQDVIIEAGELTDKAPFDQVINNTFAQKATDQAKEG